MTRCSTTSSMNSKLYNKFRRNAKLRKKHFMFQTGSFTGLPLQESPAALQNRRTPMVLTSSTVTTKPLNNAQQRGGKQRGAKHANTVTCRQNGRVEQGSDRKPSTINAVTCGEAQTGF